MRKTIICVTLSLFAAVASLRAGDDNAPAPKPAADAKPKVSQSAAASSADCCCNDGVCKMPVRKVAMSPKAAALLATK